MLPAARVHRFARAAASVRPSPAPWGFFGVLLWRDRGDKPRTEGKQTRDLCFPGPGENAPEERVKSWGGKDGDGGPTFPGFILFSALNNIRSYLVLPRNGTNCTAGWEVQAPRTMGDAAGICQAANPRACQEPGGRDGYRNTGPGPGKVTESVA